MIRLFPALILTIAVVGCSQQTVPEPVPETAPAELQPIKVSAETESEYVQTMAEALPQNMDTPANREALLSFGYSLCENAREHDISTVIAAQDHIDTLDTQDPQWMLDMGLALLAGKHSGEMLCPEYVGSPEELTTD